MSAAIKLAWAAALAGAAVVLAGCAEGPRPGDPGRPPPVEMRGSRWALVSLGGTTPEAEKPLTVELGADGRAAGFAGVNNFTGSYELQAGSGPRGRIRFGELASTKMAGPEPLMKQERDYLELLARTDSYLAEGGLLELMAAGQPTLRFRELARGTR